MQKVAIVTGAGKGIGAGIAHQLLSEHWQVVVAEIDPSLKPSSSRDSSRLLFVETDVKSEASVKTMIGEALDQFGRIDALINNAGILPTTRLPIEQLSLEQWDEMIGVNLTGAFLCSKHAVPHLRKQKGSIINIASTRALQSEPNTEPYGASKGGLVALTHALAISLGPEIRVNCISPGWIHTNQRESLKKTDHSQHPVGRVGMPQDIAAMVSFLISEHAGFITGQNFIVDGGMTKKMIYEE